MLAEAVAMDKVLKNIDNILEVLKAINTANELTKESIASLTELVRAQGERIQELETQVDQLMRAERNRQQ